MPGDGYTARAPGGITLAGAMSGANVYRASWASAAPELEGDAVHAIPKARRLGPVLEHVAQMPPAAAAVHLGAHGEEASVPGGLPGAPARAPPHRPPPPPAGVDLDGARAAAQRLGPERLERVSLRARETAERVGRDEEAPIEVAGRLLEAGGRSYYVAGGDGGA